MKPYRNFFKRAIDFVIAFLGLILLSPIFIVISLIILIAVRESPFFLQERHGKDGKLFRIIKFKTYKEKRNDIGIVHSPEERAANHERMKFFGVFLTKTSLDELPQIINVLIGDMSFIGPRPVITAYMPNYTEEQMRRHEVRPGMTGWAQVNQYRIGSHDHRNMFDVWYVDHLNLKVDLYIVWLTINHLIKPKKREVV